MKAMQAKHVMNIQKVLCVQFEKISCLLLYLAKLAKWVVSGNKMLERIQIMSILCAMNFSFILDILFLLVLCPFKLFKLQHSQLWFYRDAKNGERGKLD